eukprot:snap_masked-scaffold_3-processed-gene-17.21-mRNA-1 protein AED:1.00 eAED:1.00 QI:0/0/0/0/1/1/2/0/72
MDDSYSLDSGVNNFSVLSTYTTHSKLYSLFFLSLKNLVLSRLQINCKSQLCKFTFNAPLYFLNTHDAHIEFI